MRNIYDKLIQNLIAEFTKMPSIGMRTAERLSYYILRRSREDNQQLCETIRKVSEKILRCSQCQNFTEHDPCEICRDEKRQKDVICVVEEPHDLVAIEKTGRFNGRYHILMGALSPLEGIGPANLQISSLMKKIQVNSIREIILATNTTTEGETTALYLANLICKISPQVTVTRIAYGLAVGADLEYIDHATIAKSLEGRQVYKPQ